jgi:hypothetical protein
MRDGDRREARNSANEIDRLGVELARRIDRGCHRFEVDRRAGR